MVFHRRLTSSVDAYLTNRCKSWRSEIVLFNLPTRWFVFDDMIVEEVYTFDDLAPRMLELLPRPR